MIVPYERFKRYSFFTKIAIIFFVIFCSASFISFKRAYLVEDDPLTSDRMDEVSFERVLKARKVVITYGENCCTLAMKRLCEYALTKGKFDLCLQLNQSVIDPQFIEEHHSIFTHVTGAGYWIWKPWIINKYLNDETLLETGDFLVYMDAGTFPKRSFIEMYNYLEMNDDYNGVLFFSVKAVQYEWCKRDAFIIQKCDEDKCWHANQINSYLSIWRKSAFAIELSWKWMNECVMNDGQVVNDDRSVLGDDFSRITDHRHEHAIITNIMNREGYKYASPNSWDLGHYVQRDGYKD